MTITPGEAQILSTAAVFIICVLMYVIVRWTRSKSHDTSLWGTIFESLTHYIQPQDQLKTPQQEIRKQKRLSGDDEDKDQIQD